MVNSPVTSGAPDSTLDTTEAPPPDQRPATASVTHEPPPGAEILIEKRLTTTDCNGGGRVVLPKAAVECNFPPIPPGHKINLLLVDSWGSRHQGQLRYWENKTSKIYLMEGMAELQRLYGLSRGDTVMFSRAGQAELRVYGRKSDRPPSPPAAAAAAAPPRFAEALELPPLEASAAQRRIRLTRDLQPTAPSSIWIQPKADIDFPTQELRREDGVFREVRKGTFPGEEQPGVYPRGINRWGTVVVVQGCVYHALFYSQEEAFQAFFSAGGKLELEKEPPASFPAAASVNVV